MRQHCYFWEIPLNLEIILGKNVSVPPEKYLNEPVLKTNKIKII